MLGTVEVPGFRHLLELLPQHPTDLTDLVPLSAFLMGLVAVAVQFFSGDRPSRRSLRRGFVWGLTAVLAGFLALILLSGLRVVRVDLPGGGALRVLTSWKVRENCCPSAEGRACIEGLSLDPAILEECYGRGRLRLMEISLTLSYLVATGGFGALIGLLVLQEEARRKGRRRAGPRKKPSRPPPAKSSPE